MRSIGGYSAASALAQIIALCAALLTRRFLGPLQSGIWTALQVVLTYSNYSTLGTTEAVTREIPYYLGRGDHDRCGAIKDQVFSFVLLTSAIVAAGILMYASSMRRVLSDEIYFGLLGTAALVLLNRLNNLLIALLRAYQYFDVASRQMIATSLVNAILIAVLSYNYRMYGFMWAMGLSLAFNILIIIGCRIFTFSWRFNQRMIKQLILFGIPLMSIGMINAVFLSADKILIGYYLGMTELGWYGLALMGAQYLCTFPNSAAIVFVSHLHKRFGAMQTAESLQSYLRDTVDLFSAIMPCLIATAFFLTPYVIVSALPEFESSIVPARILLLCSFFSAIHQPYADFCVAVRDNRRILTLYVIVCPLVFILGWLAIRAGYGITGVAAATFLSIYIRFVAVFVIAERRFGSARSSLRYFAIIHLKFILLLLLVIVLELIVPKDALVDPWGSMLRATVLIAAFIPFIHRFARRFSFFQKEALGVT